jgi:SSS family solute:Na+ symporter
MANSPFTPAETAIIFIAIAAYIAFTGWLTYRLRSRTNADYMVGSRAMPALVVGVLLMSEFIGAKSTIGTAQEAFQSGMAAAWSVIGASLGFLLFGLFFAGRIYGTGEYTISAAISQRYGRGTMTMVSIIMIYALLLVNVGNYVSGAAAISQILGMKLSWSMVIIALVSTFYHVFGGMKGIAYVTLLHSALKLAGIAILAAVAVTAAGGVPELQASLPPDYFSWDGKIGIATIVAWTIATIGAIFSTQYIIQAISSTANAREARKAALYASLFCFPIGFMLAAIGVAAKLVQPDLESLYALPMFLGRMPLWMATAVTVSLVASVFVSVSTVALAIASLVIRDFYVPWRAPDADQQFRATRIAAIVIAFLPLLFALFVPEILKLSFFTRALRLSIAIVAVIGLTLPHYATARGATLALGASAAMTTGWYLLDNPGGIDNIYVALVVPLIVIFIERLFGRAPSGPEK